MASSSSVGKEGPSNTGQIQINQRLKMLYPSVNEEQTPLPRSWSPKDKYNYIGLSQNNLRVHYKGTGKTHKDAASVRATHPIPASCGIYYFEVKIISKGRDGYMGVGLSTQGVNMNRLPGWERQSYGYHGDDGHSFCSSGTGQPYGPTFTTGDVIGCCINLIDNTCFYTKNGVNLGIAFTDLPANLYPTVGLQTPGEVVEANFGHSPFIFDIEDYMKEWRLKTKTTIERFPLTCSQGEWQTALHRMVSTYLVHHGYCATAEAFAKSSGQSFDEEIASMKNRQRIQKLVLAGRMGEAIETTQSLYPGLLERNQNLLFMLKCRQFVEMVNGTDSEMRGSSMRSPRSQHSSGSNRSSPSRSPIHQSSHRVHGGYSPCPGSPNPNSQIISTKPIPEDSENNMHPVTESVLNAMNSAQKCDSPLNSDEAMDTSDNTDSINDRTEDNNSVSNGTATNGSCMNGDSRPESHKDECDMDLEPCGSRDSILRKEKLLCGGNQAAIEKMLQFGRELQTMSVQLKQEYGKNETNKKAMEDAFSLLAYADPWTSPVGYQLDPVQREPVCASLNSAILESHGLPKQPPLELAISQTSESMKLMSKVGIGACAFADVSDYLH